MISLRQLQCLVAVAETRHFGRAAQRCHITQPALSAQIRGLEEALGVMLVERSRHHVLMTPVGQALATRALGILRDVADFEDAARQSATPFNGILRLGVLPTLGSYLLPHILPALRRTYGDLKLYLREEPAGRLQADLARGDVDAMLISLDEGGSEPRGTPFREPLFREPFWAALPLGHRLAGEQLLLLEEGHCLREQVLALCLEAGAGEHAGFRATSLDSLRQMVASGLGMTVLPAMYVEAEALAAPEIAMRPFRRSPARLIGIVWRPGGAHAEEFRRLAALVRANLPAAVETVGGRG